MSCYDKHNIYMFKEGKLDMKDQIQETWQCWASGLIIDGSRVDGHSVDGSNGHVVPNLSICSFQETLNGKYLPHTISPSS